MIPQCLTLKNFLSYREATLDFRGLHTACICGANGAGKSSLLEAIIWAIWGQSRAASEDDVIHMGAQEAQVDFILTNKQQTYRVIRSRYRGQATTLEFQVLQGEWRSRSPAEENRVNDQNPSPSTSFRTLTAKGVRATQQLILEHLRLDYETFSNSAYLRQGRADEFMLKRPGERKEILADLLKLGQYDDLTERAKDQARQLKGQIELLERNLETVKAQLQESDQLGQDQAELEATLADLQAQHQIDTDRLQTLQVTQHQRQTWHQELAWQQQQHQVLQQDCQRFQRELEATYHQQQSLEGLLHQESAIIAGYRHFQTLQIQEETLSGKFKTYQQAQSQRQLYRQQQAEVTANLQVKVQHIQSQLEGLHQQETEVQHTLSKAGDIEAAMEQLRQARSRLERFDRLQAQVAPLLQRRQHLQTQLDRAHTRLATRIEELQTAARQLQTQQQRQPTLQQASIEVSDRIAILEQRRLYQQQVLDKGLERRNFMERLQADQRNYETQLAEVEQKIQLLKQEGGEVDPRQTTETRVEKGKRQKAKGKNKIAALELPNLSSSQPSSYTPRAAESGLLYASFPPCPLCDRPLDEHHWNLVMEKHQIRQQEILDQIWVIREQLAASEREIQILRQEYRDVDQELAQYDTVLERRGQLQEQLQATVEIQTLLEHMTTEVEELERSLQAGTYAAEVQEELRLLDASLQQLNYDEKDHALARGEVDRWRWAEIRQAEMRQAQRRQTQIAQRQPELEVALVALQDQLAQLQQETTDYLTAIDQHIATLGYHPEQHNELRRLLREAQPWQLRYQELGQAKQQYPSLQQRVEQLAQTLQERQQSLESGQSQITNLVQQLEHIPDCQAEIRSLEQQLQERRSHLDDTIAKLGRLQQQQQHLRELKAQNLTLKTDLQTAQRRYRVYQELAQAFGKNGIQALMIENVLPQLEAETNQILSRLSANQLHVQFVTQKSNRRNQSAKLKNQAAKLAETLDILIADAYGTRPYETYSGGEAFRVNFAIRLALARLLAHRSGTPLQMLIVDEGFGTQDAEGCERLIGAINAIAPDFACILAVTHVPHFKEAFQSRIEVYKTENGSHLNLLT